MDLDALPPFGVLGHSVENYNDLGSRTALRIPAADLDTIVEKWTRGIHFCQFRRLIEDRESISVYHLSPDDAEAIRAQILLIGESQPRGPGITVNFASQKSGDEALSIYQFGIWGKIWFQTVVSERPIDDRATSNTAERGDHPKERVMKLNARSIEMRNRLELINVAFEQGYVAYLPVVDEGIDLILYREEDRGLIKVQLKGRWGIDKKYFGRDICVAFREGECWYVAPHDVMVEIAKNLRIAARTWDTHGAYTCRRMSRRLGAAMQKYVFPPSHNSKSDERARPRTK